METITARRNQNCTIDVDYMKHHGASDDEIKMIKDKYNSTTTLRTLVSSTLKQSYRQQFVTVWVISTLLTRKENVNWVLPKLKNMQSIGKNLTGFSDLIDESFKIIEQTNKLQSVTIRTYLQELKRQVDNAWTLFSEKSEYHGNWRMIKDYENCMGFLSALSFLMNYTLWGNSDIIQAIFTDMYTLNDYDKELLKSSIREGFATIGENNA